MVLSMGIIAAMLIIAIAQAPQPAKRPPTVDLSVEVVGTIVADFSAKMDAYAALRRTLEEGLPPLTVTDDPSQIRLAERLLAERIRKARAGADRGDIFTDAIRREFRRLIETATNDGTCELIADDNPGEFQYRVNGDYPKDKPLSTVPASILAVLPRLPDDVYYRFLGYDLILHDLRANIILDRIDQSIRCR
jgi:hypothetical protein